MALTLKFLKPAGISVTKLIVKTAVLIFFAAIGAIAQTNPITAANGSAILSNLPAETAQTRTNLNTDLAQRLETLRMECIQNRRLICGKIVKVLPDGLVVDSGYTDLLRPPVNGSWLVPATVSATRPANLVEGKQPDAVCVGLVFLTDLPRSRGAKPAVRDYVIIEAFPAGQQTYTSVGDLQRTVRKFTTKVAHAVQYRFEEEEKHNAPPK